MNRTKKRIIFLIALAIFLPLFIFTFQFMAGSSYRNRLPAYPDFKILSKAVGDQIRSAGRKAYLNPSAGNLGKLGMAYQSSAMDDKAAACYRLAVLKNREGNKREWIWSYYLGCLDLAQGESKAAIDHFREALQKNPGNLLALYHTREALQSMGQTTEAKKIFQRIASMDLSEHYRKVDRENFFPLNTYAMFRLGRIFVNSNQPDSAEIILRETINKFQTFGPAYRLLGDVYTKKGNTAEGKNLIQRSNDLAEYTAPVDTLMDKIALLSRSSAYLLKQIELAKMTYNFKWEQKLCDHAMQYIPDDKYLLSNTLLLYFVLGKDKEVLSMVDRHFQSFNDDFDELMKFADLLYEKGFDQPAMNYFNQAKKLQPNASRLAIWLLDRGKQEDAVRLIKDQLQKDPTETTLTDAVHLYLNLGEKEKVKVYLEELKKLNPASIEAKKATGILDEMDGKMQEALKIYEEIVHSQPKDLAIFRYLASVYFREKMWDKAILNFKLALEDFPNDADFLDELGRLEISCPDQKLRNISEGKEFCERAFLSTKCSPPTRIMAAKNLATAYAMLGDKPMALRYINITLNMARQFGNKVNVSPADIEAFFQKLSRDYQLN